jgi:hypothetical protein
MVKLINNLFKAIRILMLLLVLTGIILGGLYLATPKRFSQPTFEHLHFRMQYIYRGQAENFGSPRYQVDYLKDVCDGTLPESPVHFHDNKDQIVHIHWTSMTGGDVLKFYGLNKIGGLDSHMGLKFDQVFNFPPKLTPIPIHSQSLPKPSGEDKFFVYIGDKDSYRSKPLDNFLSQDLETFFGKNSQIREDIEKSQKKTTINQTDTYKTHIKSVTDYLSLNAKAHSGVEHSNPTEAQKHEQDLIKAAKEQEAISNLNNSIVQSNSSSSSPTLPKSEKELTEINNLIGNVVIFVQPTEPSDVQIKARFNNLEPLGLSACGG